MIAYIKNKIDRVINKEKYTIPNYKDTLKRLEKAGIINPKEFVKLDPLTQLRVLRDCARYK